MNVSGIYNSYVANNRIGMQPEEANEHVIRALRHVIQDVFAQLSVTLVITLASRSLSMDQWFDLVLGDLGSAWSAVSVQLLRVKNSSSNVAGRKYCNLMLVDSYESLLLTHIAEDNAGYDDHEYYFILLQARDSLIKRELQLILDHCLLNYWLNCNVMVQTAQNEVLVYSYYPYTLLHCQAAQPLLVNRFDGRRMLNAPMFPQKLRQLHQCPLTLLLWHMPPFVELNWDAKESKLHATGFEMKLIEHLAQRMNFSLILHSLELQHMDSYQLAFANGTVEGPLEILLQQRANLSVGYFRKTARRNQLLTSPLSHYNVPLVATVDLEHFRFGRLALLTFPFEWCVWKTLLSALLLHGSIYVWRWRGLGLQVLELLLGATVAHLPRCWLQRIIYAHWLYGSIPLRIVYQSLLFHFIRLQLFETLPSSFEQLLGSNFRGLCTSNTLQMLREMPQVARNFESFVVAASTYDQDVLDALHQANGRRLFAITGMDLTSAHLRATNRQERYIMLTQYVNIQQVGIYMPKHSYFYAQFNDLIRRLDSGGFIDFWRRSAFGKYSPMGTHSQQEQEEQQKRQVDQHLEQAEQLKHPEQPEQERQRHIRKAQLGGIFSLICALYAFAILVFCAELLLYRVIPT